MSLKKNRVKLTKEKRDDLRERISQGKAAARKLVHARILLHADETSEAGSLKDTDIVCVKAPLISE